jgi:WD40 repeat protein
VTYTSRTFRIFVSSTFADFKEERNALQRGVFPKLRKLCEEHGCRFQAIDLRWGVREEAALDQRTVPICIEELERCQHTQLKPNFIVLLGQRYGWRPLPYEIDAEIFDDIVKRVLESEKNDEEDEALLTRWYLRDDNAVPPVYCLQPRTGEFVAQERWEPVEKQLLKIMQQAVQGMTLNDAQYFDFFGSATGQEIYYGALNVEPIEEHAFAFFRTIHNLPHDARRFVDLANGGSLDSNAQTRLADLKERLDTHLPPSNVFRYKVEWQEGDGNKGSPLPVDYQDQLCIDVYASLSSTILKEIGRIETVDVLDQEVLDHRTFGEGRAEHFTGREGILGEIAAYMRSDDNQPLVAYGASGSGKTALVAQAARVASEINPNAVVITRFIGATSASSDIRSLLESLCREISRCYEIDESTVPTDYKDLVKDFAERLGNGAEEKPLIVFLDALDQLSDADNAQRLDWIPTTLPPHARVVVSTLSSEHKAMLEQRRPPALTITLGKMLVVEGRALLDKWLTEAGRKLQPLQYQEVFTAFGKNGLPLYLKLAFEEARRWKSYSPVTSLSADVPGIIGDLFDRLSGEHGKALVSLSLGYLAAARHGLTEDELLDVLSTNKDVLADFETHAHHKLPEQRLPVVVWSRLFFDLEPYLTERRADETSLIGFYHRALAEAVTARYLTDMSEERHAALARYFGDRHTHPLFKDTARRIPDHRVASELPYQQRKGTLWRGLENTLTDLHFVEAKCVAGMTYDLITDYVRAREVLPGAREEVYEEREREEAERRYGEELIAYAKACSDFRRRERSLGKSVAAPPEHILLLPIPPPSIPSDRQDDQSGVAGDPVLSPHARVRLYHQFLNSHSHLFSKFAAVYSFCIQSAFNYADAGPVAEQAQRIITTERDTEPLLLRIRRPPFRSQESCLKTLEGHSKEVYAVSITPDGRRAVSGGVDKTVRVWNLETGECESVLEGHTNVVYAVSITPDGRRAVSGGVDKTVRVWNLETGECERVLEELLKGHSKEVYAVSITPDGRKAVSGGVDKTVRVWNLETGECEVLEGHTSGIEAVSITSDGRRAVSGSYDDTVRVWDVETRECEGVLGGHISWNSAISITMDGKRAVSGGSDNTVWVWDLEMGECERVLEGHTKDVRAISITPNGKRAVSGGSDTTVRVWDLETGECEWVLEGHTELITEVITPHESWDIGAPMLGANNNVNAVSITPDGRRAVSGADDGTVRVWNLETRKCERVLKGHTSRISAVGITQDGRWAVSGSYDDTVRVWDLEAGECEGVQKGLLKGHKAQIRPMLLRLCRERVQKGLLKGHKGWINAVSITPDGRKAVSGSNDNSVRVWDVERGKCERVLKGHNGFVEAVSITQDGRRAVSGSVDNTVRVWNLETGKCERVLEGHTRGVYAVSVTPDGRSAVSGNSYEIRVWNLETGKCERVLEGHTGAVSAVKITPDGRRAVSGSQDDTIRVWNLETRKCERVLEGPSPVLVVSITPDGRRAVSGSVDNTVRVWNLETGECERVLGRHTNWRSAISITSDGRRALLESNDDAVRKWNLDTGKFERVLEGHTDIISAVCITPNGWRVVSGSVDKTVRVWDLETDSLRFMTWLDLPVKSLAFDGVYLAVGTNDGQAIFYKLVNFFD